MTLVMDKVKAIAPEATLDLENGTWICVEHGTVMKIETGEDCPKCAGYDGSWIHMDQHWPG